MKVHGCKQGTSTWLSLRAGIPTASEFDRILTPTGKPSKSADGYMYSLLAERFMGRPLVEHVSMWMDRGSEMEADAVRFYELQKDVDTVPVGFMTNDDETIGASPDRLVAEDGLLEIKCPSPGVHMSYLLSKSVERTYYPQVMGQLWISGRQWVDLLSYHPELPPALIRCERDEEYIKTLAEAVTAFSLRLEQLYDALQAEGLVKTQPVREPTLQQLLRASLMAINANTN